MSRGKKLDHHAERATRYFVVTGDGTDGSLAERIRLDNLPAKVAGNPELLAAIHRLAQAAAGALVSKGIHKTKPARVDAKIARIIEGLKDHEVYDRLNMELSPGDAGRMMKQLESALKEHPALNSFELAQAVADELRKYRIPANTSKSGALVRTLESIGTATGFKTNAEHAVRNIK